MWATGLITFRATGPQQRESNSSTGRSVENQEFETVSTCSSMTTSSLISSLVPAVSLPILHWYFRNFRAGRRASNCNGVSTPILSTRQDCVVKAYKFINLFKSPILQLRQIEVNPRCRNEADGGPDEAILWAPV